MTNTIRGLLIVIIVSCTPNPIPSIKAPILDLLAKMPLWQEFARASKRAAEYRVLNSNFPTAQSMAA